MLRNRQAVSAEALLDQIPVMWPRSKALTPLTGQGEGWYKYDADELAQVPKCNWASFFELGRAAYTGEWAPNEPQLPAVMLPQSSEFRRSLQNPANLREALSSPDTILASA